jgi:hypothetical protein
MVGHYSRRLGDAISSVACRWPRSRSWAPAPFKVPPCRAPVLGVVAGALISATTGIPAALWTGAIGGIFACAWLIPSRLLSFRVQDDTPEPSEIAPARAQQAADIRRPMTSPDVKTV